MRENAIVALAWLACAVVAPRTAGAAAPAAGPRTEKARELALQERRGAENLMKEAGLSAADKSAARYALARARAWETALSAAAARPQDGDLVVTAAQGSAELLRGGQTLALKPGTLLREADQLSTTEGRAEIRFHDGSLLALSTGTTVKLLQVPRGLPPQSSLSLVAGALYWESRPAAGASARVLTPRASAQLRAGKALLFLDDRGGAQLSVLDGTAELTGRAEPGAQAGWWGALHDGRP